jgi:alkylhydroperoxidase family enzyme
VIAFALAAALAAPPKLDANIQGTWSKPAVPMLDLAATWEKLPPITTPRGGPLPHWARMLAHALPNTTAAMLEFDRVHRLESPLDPKLRARLRWHIANANRCEYTKRTALLDLKTAAADDNEIASLAKGDDSGFGSLPDDQRKALELVKQVTVKGADLTDSQFEAVLKAFGEKNTVAIVLLTAGANWQDRLFLSLGVPLEAEPMRAVDFRLDRSVAEDDRPEAPERVLPASTPMESWTPAEAFGSDWGQRALTELRGEMEKQKARPPRIRVPTSEEFLAATAKVPAKSGQPRRVPKIVWSLVCSGYQPDLAAAWSGNTSSFRADAKQDRVFEESLFWVVTRATDCFY